MSQGTAASYLVFVLVDGMRDDTAERCMGYLEGLVERGEAMRTRIRSVLPSLSRPCYEAIFTGTQPSRNGIVSNDTTRRSNMISVFDAFRQAGKSSAVVGYYWISELYHRAPFHRIMDVEQTDNDESYTHGRFYWDDRFPDVHAFSQAERLRQVYRPDLLVIHPMGVDDAGHRYGSASKEYDNAVAMIDMILAVCMPTWLDEGGTVIVTADHGMNAHGSHGGTEAGVRAVPFYAAGPHVYAHGVQEDGIDQTTLSGLMCRLSGVDTPATMARFPDELYGRWFAC